MAVKNNHTSLPGLSALIGLVDTLRGENGCPWDQKQTPQSMIMQLIEEAYELSGAIESGDPHAVCEELGDVLFHVFFLAQLYTETSDFTIEAVAAGITEKMIRRHPHVFGDSAVETAEDVRAQWYKIKKAEKENTKNASAASVLDSVSTALPAFMRAYRMSERAARAGFDWEDLDGVIEKAEEEWQEFKAAVREGRNQEAVLMEFGDVLFTMTNVGRFFRMHPERALTTANAKFEKRFRLLEKMIADGGQEFSSIRQEEKDRLWDQIKNQESR